MPTAPHNQLDATERVLRAWLDEFPNSAIEDRITELEDRNTILLDEHEANHREIERLKGLQEFRSRLTEASNGGGPIAAEALFPAGPGPQPESKREGVNMLFKQRPGEWHINDIRQEFIARRWINDTKKDRHALDMTLSNMVKRGELERPRMGIYRRPFRLESPKGGS